MAVSYASALKTTRMNAVIAAIDADAPAATLEIGTAGMAAVIVSITLADPSFAEAAGVITMAGVPKSGVATLAGTNTAAAARIKAGGGGVIVDGLTVGAGSGDVQLNSTSITLGQTVTITAATITHS